MNVNEIMKKLQEAKEKGDKKQIKKLEEELKRKRLFG